MRLERPPVSPDLSVVIPAHNEAARILPHLRSVAEFLTLRQRPFEIIVVDDGSTDQTASLVSGFGRTVPGLRLIRLPVCSGKGAAVRHGMQAALGLRRLFTDADGATPIDELPRLERALDAGAQIAIGSRSLASRRRDFTVRARWHRSVLGGCFNAMVRMGGIRGIADTQCGFKLFDQSVAQDLFSVSCVNGYGFDLELLYVAQRRGYRIAEVPVNWADQPGSKVRVVRDGIGMLRELTAIRRNAENGRYAIPAQASSLAPLMPTSAVTE